MPDLLSVLTPVYNGAAFLARSYHALAAQTFTDWEWVIVDDGSTDDTYELARQIASRDPRVRVDRHMPNRGRGFARMRTLALARSDWSVLHDADDMYYPQRLALVNQARRDRFDFFCSYALIVDNELRMKGVRGFFDFLGLRTFVHATLACRTDLMRSIGYEAHITTVGQIGEDHRMGLVLPARHRGCYHDGVLMVNQEDREIFLRKAIHSNRVRLDILRELASDGLFPVQPAELRRVLARHRAKLAVLNAMRLYPPVYLRTVRKRSYGVVAPGYRPSVEDLAFAEYMRCAFPSGDRPALHPAPVAIPSEHFVGAATAEPRSTLDAASTRP